MATADAAKFKARKEAFVSNLSGSSITEINLVTLVAPAAVFLWTALQKRQSLFTPYGSIPFIVEFLLNVCATLFAITAYSSAPAALNIFLVAPAILLLLPLQPSKEASNGTAKQKKVKQAPSRPSEASDESWKLISRPFLTHYRGGMMITTILAILAVDFPVFPRRYAKVETWGTSLMDLGVGSFVFSAGVVSARTLYKDNKQGALARAATAVRHAIPLLILGIIRLISVKGLDYAEHVTEYGVHWNFFFTLAFLPPFVELADSLLKLFYKQPGPAYGRLAVLIAVVYEVTLNQTSLLSYILISPRGPSLLLKNREGIFSFIGYLAIFLAGRGTGWTVVGLTLDPIQNATTQRHLDQYAVTNRERMVALVAVAFQASLSIAMYLVATNFYTFNLNVSRRLANLPYVLWVIAFNQVQILLCGIIEAFGPQFSYFKEDTTKLQNASSKVMQVFNQNGLAIFLVANLLTGLVNLTVDTLDMSSIGAMAILIAYAAVVTGFAIALSYSGLKIRL